jgi:hypothetical protein
LWAQRGGEGDGVFVDLARVGVDAEDDVFEYALEYSCQVVSLISVHGRDSLT